MNEIVKANLKDAKILSKLSIESFLPAHGHSAPKKEIDEYVSKNFTEENYKKELSNLLNNYYLYFTKNKISGYSKVVFNDTCPDISSRNISYLSRIYFLEEFYGKGFAKELLEFNCKLCKENNQKGIWLKVWIENKRAIQFYKKMGFRIVGESGFKVTENHSNPNYHMYLEF